jgi:pimeloyl-ACP methyl ester carboxylesterase
LALALLNVGIPEADRAALGQPANRAIVSASIQEGLRPGTRGALLDFALYTRPWDFELAGIACPISFWHGDIDATVPPDHSRIIADSLPRAMVHNFPGEGHFSLPINRSQEILRALLNC